MRQPEDYGFRIPPGKVAVFSLMKEDLEDILDKLPIDQKEIQFKMDWKGTVSYAEDIDDD